MSSSSEPALAPPATAPSRAADGYIVGQGLSLSFLGPDGKSELEVLREVSFSIAQGSIVSIIGPSGCGKTTLLNCIGGLLSPRRGNLAVDGKSADQARRERYFGLVPQEPCLFEWKTVFDNISLPFEIFGNRQERATVRGHVQDLIRLVGLSGFEQVYPFALSGGMKQRASLARALSYDPPVMLMDEPFGALDAQTREEMNLEVLRIWSTIKNTVVLITHDVTEAVLLSDQVLVMSRRPSNIRTVIPVDIPRPRDREVLDSPELHRYTRQIRELLSPERRPSAPPSSDRTRAG
jgi:NitT/TauT family transport system ATP-binding protein